MTNNGYNTYYGPPAPSNADALTRWFQRIIDCVRTSWVVFLIQGIITVAALAVCATLAMVIVWPTMAIMVSGSHSGSEAPMGMLVLIFAGMALVVLGTAVLYTFFYAGMVYTALRALRGHPVTVTDLFAVTPMLPRLILVSILTGLLVLVGYALCIIPGLYFSVALLLAVPLVIDRQAGAVGSLTESAGLVQQNFWMVAVFALLLWAASSILSSIGIGAFITPPLMAIAVAVIYEDLQQTVA